MASKLQQTIQFPVRKSGRQIKPTRVLLEAKENSCFEKTSKVKINPKKETNVKRSSSIGRKQLELDTKSPHKVNGRPHRDKTPQKSTSRWKDPEVLTPSRSPSKSPSKRKSTCHASPPTPPKSPCKSLNRQSCKITRPRSQSPSIHSEESDEDCEEQTRTRSLLPHNITTEQLTPRKVLLEGRLPCTPETPNAAALASLKKSRTQAQDAVEAVSSVSAPSTPSKTLSTSDRLPDNRKIDSFHESHLSCPLRQHSHREILSPRKTKPAFSLCKISNNARNENECSPRKLSTPQTFQPCGSGLSPQKNASCTPQKLSVNRRLLSPAKSGSEQRGAAERGVYSPRKKAEQENNFTLASPKMPPKLQIARQDNSSYQRVKQSLHTAKPHQLVGRESEVGEILDFMNSHFDQGSAGSLYISGAPGTGKTAALLHIIDDFRMKHTCRIAYLNCMLVKDVNCVFRRLYSELSSKPSAGRTSAKDVEKLITSSKHNMILILDEIDQLDSKNQDVLYTIFEWPSLPHSKLILLGVANALDLTDRILPRLQAKPRCKPKLLHFAPYTRTQISAILNNRLQQAGEMIVENSAVQLCARKVSAVAGDMRKALDVCRRAVELAESETRSQTILRVTDCNSPSKKSNLAAVKKIGVSHVSRVMAEVYGSSVQSQQSEGVPLQQKLLVCTLLLMVKTGKFKEVPLGKLHETYCKVCRSQQLTPVDQSEFHSLCVLLEARGIIGIKKAKETRLFKITLRQEEKELEDTLKDKRLVSTILADGLPK